MAGQSWVGRHKLLTLIIVAALIAAGLSMVKDEPPAARRAGGGTVARRSADANGAAGVRLVDFAADWCGPCKIQAPIIQQVAENFADRVMVDTVDIEQDPDLATSFGVTAIPTIIIFKGDKAERRFVGVQDYETLEKALGDVLD